MITTEDIITLLSVFNNGENQLTLRLLHFLLNLQRQYILLFARGQVIQQPEELQPIILQPVALLCFMDMREILDYG